MLLLSYLCKTNTCSLNSSLVEYSIGMVIISSTGLYLYLDNYLIKSHNVFLHAYKQSLMKKIGLLRKLDNSKVRQFSVLVAQCSRALGHGIIPSAGVANYCLSGDKSRSSHLT